MTGRDKPLPVPCAGCGKPTPYEVGEQHGVGSFGEVLSTPLGDCFRRTCWTHECVRASRAAVGGRPVTRRTEGQDS